MMIAKTGFKMLLTLFIVNNASAAFFEKHSEGWHWYQDPIIKNQETEMLKSKTPTEIVKAKSQELEEKLHLALLEPNHQNIKAYQEKQKDLMDLAGRFSKTWMQVVYQNPHLDHTLVSPVNQNARHIYLDQEQMKTRNIIKKLKNQYGLFFFFKSDCDYCDKFAPIVKQFADQYEWQLIAISLDGGFIPGFKEVLVDNGIFNKLQVKVVPAVFAVDPKGEKLLPIAYGLTSLDEMENRIMALIGDLYA